MGLFGKILTPHLINYWGFSTYNLYLSFLNCSIYLLLILGGMNSPIAVFMTPLIGRMVSHSTNVYIQIVKFQLFDSNVAMKISKVFDSCYLIGMSIGLTLNYFLFDENRMDIILSGMLSISILSLAIFKFKFKNFDSWATNFKINSLE